MRDGFGHLVLEQVQGGAEGLALVRRHGAQRLHLLGDHALLAQRVDAHGLKGGLVGGGVDERQCFGFECLKRHRCSPKNKKPGPE